MSEQKTQRWLNWAIILLGLLTLFLWTWNRENLKQTLPSVHVTNNSLSSEVKIDTFWVFGPLQLPDDIKYPTKIKLNKYNFFEAHGVETQESEVTLQSFHQLEKSLRSKNLIAENHFNSILFGSEPVFNFDHLFKEIKLASVYLACEIESDQEREIALISGARDITKIWLNHQLVTEFTSTRWVEKYTDISRIKLKKGNNLLLVKVSRHMGWGLSLSLTNLENAKRMEKENFNVRLLSSRIIPFQGNLKKRNGAISLDDAKEIRLLDAKGEELPWNGFNGNTVTLDEFKEGLYTIEAKFTDKTRKEDFYIGNIAKFCQKIRSEFTAILQKINDPDTINLETLIKRLEYLANPSKLHREPVLGEIETVERIRALHSLTSYLEANDSSYRSAPGKHLRGYISEIDQTLQHYQVFVPQTTLTPEKGFPLVVVYPTRAETRPHFLMSFHLEFKDIIDTFIKESSKNGFIVLWPFARNEKRSLIGNVDVFESIQAVQNDYAINPNKTYLAGGCDGARESIMIAARNPSYFAAIGLYEPIINEDYLSKEPSVEARKEEFKYSSPILWLKNLQNTPIYIAHGELDSHIPLAYSTYYMQKAQEAGVEIELDIIQGGTESYFPKQDNQQIAQIVNFFQGKERKKRPQKIVLQVNNTSALSSDWLTVQPTHLGREFALCTAEFISPNELSITTDGMTALTIDLTKTPWRVGEPLKVTIDGETYYDNTPQETELIFQLKTLLKKKTTSKN